MLGNTRGSFEQEIFTDPLRILQVSEVHAANEQLNEKMKQLEQSYGTLRNSTNVMLAAAPDVQAQKLSRAKSLEESVGGDATTEQNHSVLGKLTRCITWFADFKGKRFFGQTES